MVKTVMQVEGMMCGHCEAHVNKAIANAFEVKEVVSSHEKNTTEILSEQPLDEAKLRATVEGLDYKVGAITVEIA